MSEFNFTSSSSAKVTAAVGCGVHPLYVPYVEFNCRELPKFMDITNHDRRVYLKEERQPINNVISCDLEINHQSIDSKRFLDLGVAPLQRIINELKSISVEANDESYSQKTTKASSGLVNYCGYLQGDPRGRM